MQIFNLYILAFETTLQISSFKFSCKKINIEKKRVRRLKGRRDVAHQPLRMSLGFPPPYGRAGSCRLPGRCVVGFDIITLLTSVHIEIKIAFFFAVDVLGRPGI